MPRRLTIILLVAALGLAAAALWLFLRSRVPVPDRLVLQAASFDSLPGWREDAADAALPAFLRSCRRLVATAAGAERDGTNLSGTADDWREVCREAAKVPLRGTAARAFFEARFQPVAATNHGEPRGLFTGYYEPTLRGSLRRHGRYTVPLYARPAELVTVDLGRFREEWKGERIAGSVVDGTLVPFPDRAAIAAGALAGRGLEVVWVDDPVDAFFLEIQGSGRVELAEGGVLRLGYAAQNGRPYFAIGRELVERGALKKEEVSLQSIRRWLGDHPSEVAKVLARNPSYVFFQRLLGDGPVGAEGVVLTPGRSLAVDLKYLPLGIPVWLDASAPTATGTDRPLRRLLIAQDTGGAIRGPVRGDVFWGNGEEAAAVAGRMKSPGRLWLLLPKTLARRALSASRAPA
ncbi:MAG TPA: MltA domain-containing protein [Thermoanaerobaculia bacterium]|nr:MltA domain-containing protein [Thermoanaerobaculia bacterium]